MPRHPITLLPLVRGLVSCVLAYVLLVTLTVPLAVGRTTVTAGAAKKAHSSAAPTVQHAGRRAGELLVRFRPNSSEHDRTSAVERRGGRRGQHLRGHSQIERITLAGGQDVEAVAAQLRNDPAVEFAEPNFIVNKDQTTPNDPRFSEQWALKNTGQGSGQAGADVGADAA